MSQNIYPKGIRTFHPHENAPQFVQGTMIIGEDFLEWFDQHATPSQYGRQVKLTMMIPQDTSKSPINLKLDTWQPQQQQHSRRQVPPPPRQQQQRPAPPPMFPQTPAPPPFNTNSEESFDDQAIPF